MIYLAIVGVLIAMLNTIMMYCCILAGKKADERSAINETNIQNFFRE